MKFSCEQCQTKYNLPDERVRGKVLKIRCKKCGCQITVSQGGVRTSRNDGDGEDATMVGSRASVAAMTGGKVPAGGGGGGGHDDGGEGGDSTMIGGMNDFFANLAGAGSQAQVPDEWHLSIDGNVVDPMPLADLAQRVVVELATPGRDMYVWREGQPEWLPPDSIPEVQAAVEKAKRNPAPPKAAAKPAPAAAAGLGDEDEDEGGDKTQMGSLDFAALGLEAKAPWEEAAAKSEPAKADAKSAAKSAGKDAAKDSPAAKTAAKDSAKDTAKAGAKGALASAAKDAGAKVDAVKSAAKDAVGSLKSAAKDAVGSLKSAAKDAAKDTAKPAAKDAAKEVPAAKAAPKADADDLLEDDALESVDAIEEDIAMPAPPPK
ncbi:MAG TPA: zinc-ribbon domain-containing protein, partial [Pseudomonadota bacterium]|nr:zinc-ribbon domain-containing protein [Pseudomonadota bacterium]